MPRVKLTNPLKFNLTGYAPLATEYAAGDQDVPEVVAEFVARHPELGTVTEETAPAAEESEEATEAEDEEVTEETAPAAERQSRRRR